jgi:hypothetical protein
MESVYKMEIQLDGRSRYKEDNEKVEDNVKLNHFLVKNLTWVHDAIWIDESFNLLH